MTDKKVFQMQKEWQAQFSILDNESAGALIKAIFEYQTTGEVPSDMSPIVFVAFSFICQQIDRDESEEEFAESNRRGAPKGNANARKKGTSCEEIPEDDCEEIFDDENNSETIQNNSKTNKNNSGGIEFNSKTIQNNSKTNKNNSKQFENNSKQFENNSKQIREREKESEEKEERSKEEKEDKEIEKENIYINNSDELFSAVASEKLPPLPLNDGSNYRISEQDFESFTALYPGIDVTQQVRNMAGWLIANPNNRKTKTGIRRFINNWLSREQNKAPRASSQAPPNSYSNLDRVFAELDERRERSNL